MPGLRSLFLLTSCNCWRGCHPEMRSNGSGWNQLKLAQLRPEIVWVALCWFCSAGKMAQDLTCPQGNGSYIPWLGNTPSWSFPRQAEETTPNIKKTRSFSFCKPKPCARHPQWTRLRKFPHTFLKSDLQSYNKINTPPLRFYIFSHAKIKYAKNEELKISTPHFSHTRPHLFPDHQFSLILFIKATLRFVCIKQRTYSLTAPTSFQAFS